MRPHSLRSSRGSWIPGQLGALSPEPQCRPQPSTQVHRSHGPGGHSCLLLRPQRSTDGRRTESGPLFFSDAYILKLLFLFCAFSGNGALRRKHTSSPQEPLDLPSCYQASRSGLQGDQATCAQAWPLGRHGSGGWRGAVVLR